MITSMRRCVAYNDLWPWPISSRSFGLDLENRVLSVASTVLDGFFPYVVQMITSMRRCGACDDLWPWPISSRSFGLDLENRVLSVASTVLDGFFPYLVQMISSMRRCVACDDLWPWPISSRSFDLDFENRVRSVTFSVLDRLFFWLGIQYDSIMWVIMRRRGVSSERRRSSYSSFAMVWDKCLQFDNSHCSGTFSTLFCLLHNCLTHWGQDKIAVISQMTFSNASSRTKMYGFWLRFHLKFVPDVQINNIPGLVQIMAWRRPGDKPLSEPRMVNSLMHICVTQPQHVDFHWTQKASPWYRCVHT